MKSLMVWVLLASMPALADDTEKARTALLRRSSSTKPATLKTRSRSSKPRRRSSRTR